jgi:CheY-like chemotaxis protein
VFKVKLFLPEVHVASGVNAAVQGSLTVSHKFVPRQPRLGYTGPRQRILVVDNEEADRDLLARLLQPLGFELRSAASGHDCLDLLTAGYQPDVILMDLAMPGIDGWETLRRIRALQSIGPQVKAQIAIVSANAFDRGLDNDLGIPGTDFILKPVRHSELLDWLTQRLSLTWLSVAPTAEPATPTEASAMIYPGLQQLDALREVVNLGYYRGIMNTLDEIEAGQPQNAAFVADMRGLARQFQFEAMSQQLSQVFDEH